MKKLTAVEWLMEEYINGAVINIQIMKKALEIEREQHSKTWNVALDKYEVRAGNYMRAYEDFDEYYNETFKSE